MKKLKALKATISAGSWSYIVNQNGNAIRTTLYGYGSCTPFNVLQEWIDKLSQKEIKKLADECDKRKDIKD